MFLSFIFSHFATELQRFPGLVVLVCRENVPRVLLLILVNGDLQLDDGLSGALHGGDVGRVWKSLVNGVGALATDFELRVQLQNPPSLIFEVQGDHKIYKTANFLKNSLNNLQAKKAKISTTKLSLKVQNIHIKPLLKH